MKQIAILMIFLCVTINLVAQSEDFSVITLENIQELSLVDAIHCPLVYFANYREIELSVSGNHLLAIKGCDGAHSVVKIYDMIEHRMIQEIDTYTYGDGVVVLCHFIHLSYDGRYFACSESYTGHPTIISIFDLATASLVLKTYIPQDLSEQYRDYRIRRVVFSADSQYFYVFITELSTSQFHNLVQIWDFETGEYIEYVPEEELADLYPLPPQPETILEIHSNYDSPTGIETLNLSPVDSEEVVTWFISSDWDYVMGSRHRYGYEPVGEDVLSDDGTTIALSIPDFILIYGISTENPPVYFRVPAFIYPSSIQVREQGNYSASVIGIAEEGRVLVDGRSEDNQFLHIQDVGWVIANYVDISLMPIESLAIK